MIKGKQPTVPKAAQPSSKGKAPTSKGHMSTSKGHNPKRGR